MGLGVGVVRSWCGNVCVVLFCDPVELEMIL